MFTLYFNKLNAPPFLKSYRPPCLEYAAELTNAKALRVVGSYTRWLLRCFGLFRMLLPVLRSLIPRTSKGSSRVHVVASAVVQVHSAPKSPINYKENMQLDYLVTFDTLFLSTI